MATLEDVNHDSGGTPGNHWDTVTDASARLSVTGAAALNGTDNGLQIDYSAANTWEVDQAFTPPASQLALTFYFDPNGAGTPTVGDKVICGVGLSEGDRFDIGVGQVTISKTTAGDIVLGVSVNEDGGGGGTAGPFTLTDAPHKFEIHANRAATDVSADGTVKFYVDGVLKDSETGLDNYDLFGTTDAIFAWGAALEAAMSGTTVYLDEVLLEDVIIFSGYDLVLGGGLA